jgi:D-alanyl-D-alanine dipeptidase
MIVTFSDPRVAHVPVRDCGETLVDVRTSAPLIVAKEAYLRHGVVDRLVTAQSLLPRDVRLLIVHGYRPPGLPCQHLNCAVEEATSRCVIPPAVAPHPTGGAVDLTLSNEDNRALPACCTSTTPHPSESTQLLLVSALTAAGLVNYPARWWHWSYGDPYWAYTTRAPHARYGPLPTH